MKLNLPQYAFNAGALGSKMLSRTDIEELNRKGCKDLENMIPMPQGLAIRRPGTKYVRKAHAQDGTARLVSFIYDAENNYTLEFSENEIRIFKGRFPVMQDSYVVLNGSFAGSLTSWTDISDVDGQVTAIDDEADFLGDVLGEADGEPAYWGRITQQVTTSLTGINSYAVVLDNRKAPNIVGDAFRVFIKVGTTSGGSDILGRTMIDEGIFKAVYFDTDETTFYITIEAAANRVDNVALYQNVVIQNTGLSGDDIQNMSYTLSGQKLYMAFQNKAPKYLFRTSDSDWFLLPLQTLDGPYFDLADPQYSGRGTNISLSFGATTGTTTATASDNLFQTADVGRHLRYRHVDTADWGWAIITQFISPTQVLINIKKNFSDKTASTEWVLGAWGETAGYPSVVSASTGRICWANSPSQPNGFWASRVSAPNVYSPDEAFDDNITAATAISTIFAEAVDINSLASGNNKMFVGSSSGIFSITGLAEGLYGISVQRIDSARTARIMPVSSQGSAFFVSGGQRNLYKISYTYEQLEEGYRAEDVTDLNDDYSQLIFVEGAVIHSPKPVLWFRTLTGQLLSFTYAKSDKIMAWAQHTLGGEDAYVESMAVQPRAGSDDLWLIVARTINGQTVRFVEYMSDFQTNAMNKYETCYLDASVKYSGPAISRPAGANHLIGSSGIGATVNGTHYSLTSLNAGGGFSTEFPATDITLGLSYTSQVTLIHREGGAQTGSVFGRPYRVSNIHVRFWNSASCALNFEQAALQNFSNLIYFNENLEYGQGPDLFTGWKTVRINSGAFKEVNPTLTTTDSLPMNIQAVCVEIEPSEF